MREENEMKRKILAAVFLTVTATSAFTGTDLILAAEKTEETAVQKPDMEGIDTENTKIGISIYQFEDTFMTLYRTELVRYLTEELGFDEKNIIVEDGKNDQEKQTDQIERFIADQADVMILNLVHASAAPMITDFCSEAGIPVVYINRQPDSMEMERWDLEGIQAAYIGADARQSGIFQGEEIAETENKGDVNGDGEITPEDRTMIGNPTPKVTYGFSLGVDYKNWSLGIDMMGQGGNKIFRTWDNYNFAQFNYLEQRLDRWHGEGTSNTQPLLDTKHSINNLNSDYYIEDGKFFRIRNVQLAYTFDKSLISKIRLQALKVYVNIQNLKTWKHNTGYTPELGGTATAFGVDNGSYPVPAVYTFGINLTF